MAVVGAEVEDECMVMVPVGDEGEEEEESDEDEEDGLEGEAEEEGKFMMEMVGSQVNPNGCA